MSRHVNIPIFIPHLGCPNQCVFCNQRTISGVKEFVADDVRKIIDESLSTVSSDDEVEIAFFGGSFTGIDPELMTELLAVAYSYVESGRVSSLRCSTRPDYISADILALLKKHGVKVIELGLQSISDQVLEITKRGHTAECARAACKMIVESGFLLVGQMMIGLPGSTIENELETADFIINSGATAARIYPTVVFNDTELRQMTLDGIYTPLSLEEAVSRSASVMQKLINAGVEVIRVGLCASENLSDEKTYFAGPNHSAIGELVENEIYYEKIKNQLLGFDLPIGDIIVYVPCGAVSKAVGQKRKNKLKLMASFGITDVVFKEKSGLLPYETRVERKNRCT